MTEFIQDVSLRTLYSTSGRVVCINGYKPSAMHRMTGNPGDLRLIEVWVEDPLASRIVEQISVELGLLGNLQTKQFGAIDNAFSVAATLELDGADSNKNLVVIDGDRYRTMKDKLSRFNSTLSGTGAQIQTMRKSALSWLEQLNPVIGELDGEAIPAASPVAPIKPERYLLDAAMRAYQAGNANAYIAQFFNFAAENVFADPDKSLIYNIHKHFNITIERVELLLIDAAATDSSWSAFTGQVRDRLRQMAMALNLDVNEGA